MALRIDERTERPGADRAFRSRTSRSHPQPDSASERPAPRRRNWRAECARQIAVLDAAWFVIAAELAQHITPTSTWAVRAEEHPIPYWAVIAVATPVWTAALASAGCYRRRTQFLGSEEYRRVLDGAIRFVALVALGAFFLRTTVARTVVLTAVPTAVTFGFVIRQGIRWWMRSDHGRVGYIDRLVVVGSRNDCRNLLTHLRWTPGARLRVAAAFTGEEGGLIPYGSSGVPVLGSDRKELIRRLEAGDFEAVAVVDPSPLGEGGLRQFGWDLEGVDVDLLLTPSAIDVAGGRCRPHPVAGLPLVHVETPRLGGAMRRVKDWGERVIAVVAIVFASPIMAGVAIAVKCSSRGPVLFRQVRVGRNAEPFSMLKFRTMAADAEQQRTRIIDLNQADGLLFKVRDDPRVTRLGRCLRRLSLDELPQLWNVVRGEMSIVGPRPPLPTEVAQYGEDVRRRLLVKPGLTGLWQVNGRSDLCWEDSVYLDLHYIDNWSLTLDLVIVARTINAVIRQRGAY